MDFRSTLQTFIFRWKLFIFTGVITFIVLFIGLWKLNIVKDEPIEHNQTDSYSSMTTLLEVSSHKKVSSPVSADLNVSLWFEDKYTNYFVNSLNEYISTEKFIQTISKRADVSDEEVEDMISISHAGSAGFIELTIYGKDENVFEKLNLIVINELKSYSLKLTGYKVIDTVFDSVRNAKPLPPDKVDNSNIITVDPFAITPFTKLEVFFISAILSLLSAIAVVFIRELADYTIRSKQKLSQITDIPILPVLRKNPSDTEAYALAQSISDKLNNEKIIAIASINKSNKANNLNRLLAKSCANIDNSVLLLNLCATASTTVKLDEYADEISLVVDNKSPGYFTSSSFGDIIENYKKTYNLIIISAPDLQSSATICSLSNNYYVALLVAYAKDTDESFNKAIESFGINKKNILGITIINYVSESQYLLGEPKKNAENNQNQIC